ncbi:MAG: SlyX family protein [Sulfuricaulis sp.]
MFIECVDARANEGGMNERLTELETRVTFQEQTLQELNDVVTRQQTQIERLTKEVTTLKSSLAGLAPAAVIPMEEEKPPPHY